MKPQFRLGVQSYCFRKFQPLARLIDCLKETGLSYVELWPGHLDFKVEPAEIRQALESLHANGITADSYGVVGFGHDEVQNRRVLELARLAHMASVSADIEPDAVQRVDGLAQEYGINLAVHNHGRKHRYGSAQSLRELFGRTSERIGLCMDTAWMLDAGEDPLALVDEFGDRLYGVHIKDFIFPEGKHQDVIVGTGGLDLPGLMKRLANINFHGYLSLEYEGDADDPIPAVKQCVAAVNQAIDAL